MVGRRNSSTMFFLEQAAGQGGGGSPAAPQSVQPFATDKGPKRMSEDDFNNLPSSVQDEVQEMHPDLVITPGEAANGKLPPEYAKLFETKEKSGTTMMAVDTYSGPFTANPEDDAIRATRANYVGQWDRMSENSVRVERVDGDTRTVDQVFRNADGTTTVFTDQTQRDNAVNHANSETARNKAQGSPDGEMTVHVVKQYDRDGVLVERTVERTMDGGASSMTSTAKVKEEYENGRLASSDFYSSTRTTDDKGVSVMTTVDKHAAMDEQGVATMHRQYQTIKTEGRTETVMRTTQDSHRDKQVVDGRNTYTMQTDSYQMVDNQTVATDKSTYIASDSEGMQGLSGNRVVDDRGKKTTFKVDAGQHGWVVDTAPDSGPVQDQGLKQNQKAVYAQVPRNSLSAPS